MTLCGIDKHQHSDHYIHMHLFVFLSFWFGSSFLAQVCSAQVVVGSRFVGSSFLFGSSFFGSSFLCLLKFFGHAYCARGFGDWDYYNMLLSRLLLL